jgi:AraC-like DNA-binding protein
MYAGFVTIAPPPFRSGFGDERQLRCLSLRTVRRGALTISWRQRMVRVDADVYAVTSPAQPAAPVDAGTEPFSVELPIGDSSVAGAVDFTQALRSMSGPVGRTMSELARSTGQDRRVVAAGRTAASLWSDLLAEERLLRARATRIGCVKPGTREALFRRLLVSADYIHANFAEPLNVELLAQVSHLSPFHFARLFALVMDETPHAFLVRKRLAVARRLRASGIGRREAAERAGFGSRTTLFRHLREAAAKPS